MKTCISIVTLALCLTGCSSSDTSADTTGTGPTTTNATSSSSAGGTSGTAGAGGATGSTASTGTGMSDTLALTSPEFMNAEEMPADASCDGAGKSPALAWAGVPDGTKEFALLMSTVAKDGIKYTWVLYGIPASTTSLANGSTGIGTAGITSNGPNLAYSPPCSSGPGTKTYTFTLYALSGTPTLPSDPKSVTGAVLEQAIASLTLQKSSLDGEHTRP